MIKKILLFVVALIGLVLLMAFFLPSEYDVVRKTTINQNRDELFDYLKYLRNQEEFSVWARMDPNQKNTYRGVDGEVGFVNRWESDIDSVGVGEQEIKNIIDGERIDYEVRFIKPFESTATAYITTKAINPTTTEVVWGFHGEMPYPINLFLLVMDMEKMLGKDLEGGLANLKEIQERKAVASPVAQPAD